MLRSRRIAFAAAAIVLGLSACGDAGSTISTGKAPAVIHLGAAGGTNKLAAPTAGGEAADSMMRPYGVITYVYDGTYPDLGASGPAFQVPAGTQVDAAAVAKLAAALGVQGEPRQLPADQGGGWMVGAADYSSANVTVAADGLASWWFNPTPAATSSSGCVGIAKPIQMPDEGVADSGSGSSAGSAGGTEAVAPPETIAIDPGVNCEAPPAPVNVPTKAQAEEKARQLMTAVGLDAAQYEFTTYADDYSANATAWLMLGGHRSPIQFNVGFGGEGALMWASGSLAVPVPAADYPVVTPQEALARLSDPSGRWMNFGAPFGVAMRGGVAMADAVASVGGDVASSGEGGAPAEPTAAPTVGAPEPAPVCDPAADCVVSPMPTPDPITIHLNGVRLDVTMVWDADGSIWLLPAYTFTSADGGEFTVVAVDDSLLDLPEPAPVDTTPAPVPVPPDTVVVPVDTVVVGPTDTVAPVPGGGLGTVPPDFSIPPAGDPTMESAALLVGLTVDDATQAAEANGWVLRVSTLDGVGQILTADFVTNRVDVAVEAGVVTGIDNIG